MISREPLVDIVDALPSRRGHFLLESGYHTDVWLTLDAMFVDPAAIAPQVAALAAQLRPHAPTAICGPLFGGAFLAQALASQLGVKFFVVEPAPAPAPAPTGPTGALFSARYQLPRGQRSLVRGERIAVVDDVISAGSSVRAAITALIDAGASITAVGALLVPGDVGLGHFAARALPVESLGRRSLSLWSPGDCPMCRAGAPLSSPEGAERDDRDERAG